MLVGLWDFSPQAHWDLENRAHRILAKSDDTLYCRKISNLWLTQSTSWGSLAKIDQDNNRSSNCQHHPEMKCDKPYLVFFYLLQNWWEKVLFTLEDFQCPSFWLLHWEVNENPETLFAFILHKHVALYYTCVAGMFSLKLVSRHGVQFQNHSIVTRTPEAKWVWLMCMQQWGTHCK